MLSVNIFPVKFSIKFIRRYFVLSKIALCSIRSVLLNMGLCFRHLRIGSKKNLNLQKLILLVDGDQ